MKKSKTKVMHKNLIEFKKRAPCDGFILYSSEKKDEIIKVKPIELLTVDLVYDGNSIFLDSSDNCYVFQPKVVAF